MLPHLIVYIKYQQKPQFVNVIVVHAHKSRNKTIWIAFNFNFEKLKRILFSRPIFPSMRKRVILKRFHWYVRIPNSEFRMPYDNIIASALFYMVNFSWREFSSALIYAIKKSFDLCIARVARFILTNQMPFCRM